MLLAPLVPLETLDFALLAVLELSFLLLLISPYTVLLSAAASLLNLGLLVLRPSSEVMDSETPLRALALLWRELFPYSASLPPLLQRCSLELAARDLERLETLPALLAFFPLRVLSMLATVTVLRGGLELWLCEP